MQTTVTIPWFAVLAIFLLGVAVGWIMSKLRVIGNISLQVSPGGAFAPKAFNITRSTVRKLLLKCQCGAVWNFQEGSSGSPDNPPFPTGDSFVCPKCGRSIDLKLERQAEADLLRDLNLPNQS